MVSWERSLIQAKCSALGILCLWVHECYDSLHQLPTGLWAQTIAVVQGLSGSEQKGLCETSSFRQGEQRKRWWRAVGLRRQAGKLSTQLSPAEEDEDKIQVLLQVETMAQVQMVLPVEKLNSDNLT